MMPLPHARLDSLIDRFRAVEHALSASPDAEHYVRLSREYAELSPLIEKILALRQARADLAGTCEILAQESDSDLLEMAQEDRQRQEQRIEQLTHDIRLGLLPKDAMDERGVILEIRAGTGGDEASLFAGDLFRMYERYAALKGWRVETISLSEGSMGGFKEIIAHLHGAGVYARLKFESGTHRVQRVPDTEASGRIHTSAATVAVLPEVEEVDVAINDADLRIDTMRAGGAGGQHVNKTESAVRITHMPSGIVVLVQDERSQHRNKAQAMALLRAKLYEMEQEKRDQARAADRKLQVGSGDRSERIRTYNFPQGRVTDHRIELTLYRLPEIISGQALDEVIEPLITEHQAQLLAAENETTR